MPRAAAIAPYLDRIDAAGWYTNFGPLLSSFEARLAGRLAPPAATATVSSGTTGLTLALRALGAREGALCAMPAFTFVATPHAALGAGLVPYFLDVDEETWMLDPSATVDAVRRAPGPVGAIIPVAAFGRLPDLEAWRGVAHATGLPVVVDAAAAFDALRAAPVPTVVSMHATKALGVGEGGFVAAEDPRIIQRVRELTSFGFRGSRTAQLPAANAKLSEYAAAVGHASLDGWTATRLAYVRTAQKLRIALAGLPEIRFQPGWGLEWISSVCVVGVPDGAAGRLEARLAADGVTTRAWWNAGCDLEPAFSACPAAPLPTTRRLAASTVGLPFWPDMTLEEINRVARALGRAVSGL